MNNLTVLSTGTPIIPYQIQVDLDIQATCNFTERVASTLTGSALNDFFAGYVQQAESVQKTHSDFSTQDETRNATFTLTEIGVNSEDPNKTDYDLNYTFTVNATATMLDACQSNAETQEELDVFFSQKVIQIEYDWYNVRPQWTKTN
jgi:hypothetical protein